MRTRATLIRIVTLIAVFVPANLFVTSAVQGQRTYRETEINMRNLISRIDTRSETFSRTLQNALGRSTRTDTARDAEIRRLVTDFEFATDQLRTRFENRQSTAADARAVLERGALIDRFLVNNRFDYRVEQDWRLLRTDLDQLANAYYINWRWDTVTSGNASGNASGNTSGNDSYNLNDAEMRRLIQQIESRSVTFSRNFRNQLNRVSASDRYSIEEAQRHLSQFETATTRLRNRVNTRQSSEADVRAVLEHAAYLNSFMASHQLGYAAQNNWNLLRQDLDRLASAYSVAWNWDQPVPGGTGSNVDAYLTGTYRLDTSRSTDPRKAAEEATRNLPASQRQRVYQNLLARLEAPDTLAFERRGNNVVIASSRAPQVNFTADGREHIETTPSGRTVRVRASLTGDELTVARTGDREQDFTVTFDPIDNGRRLVVTRRLDSPQLSQPITVQSYYDKTSDVAQLNLYSTSPDNTGGETASGDFIIPNGTQVVAVLNSDLSTQASREGDRFSMTVRSPAEYDGATIEGRVVSVNRSGRVTGRSEMSLSFDTIRLREGRSYRFAGIMEAVRTPGNESVRVDNEGSVRDDNQTERTIQRSAIGSAVGAIIGAIAGGGKGAAIGAVIGAGAGAGSVYVQGRDDLNLTAGTELTIRATGPR